MNKILLSNLIKIRWIAVFGQLSAIFFINYITEITIPFYETLFVVSILILVNLFSYYLQKKHRHLRDFQVFLFLLFDISQLGLLLYLTGGIYNPFCILIIAPVIISASYLTLLFTIILSFFSITLVSFLFVYYIPINWNYNFIFPQIYSFGILSGLIIAIIFISIYSYLLASSSRKISDALSETKLQLSNQKKIKEVGSLSAAAVHELSTPLNTIFLILNDLLKEKKLIKDTNILKDIELLKSQAERCKDILLRLSKNTLNLKDTFFEKIKLTDLIKLNFQKYNTNKKINIKNKFKDYEVEIIYKEEIMYAIGNIIQNAIIYSKNNVFVELKEEDEKIIVVISDDGFGFSREILDKIGDPYISKNNKGMGLGIFISKNLIENLGGNIKFYNSKDNKAFVEIILNKSILYL